MAFVIVFALVFSEKKYRNTFIIVSGIAMFVIMGFRDAYKIGNDSRSSYLASFNEIADVSWDHLFSNIFKDYNYGFKILQKAGYQITGGDYQKFIIILSAIIIICFTHFILRYSSSPLQSICYYWGLLYYIFMFSAEKQALAMSILLLAYDAIVDKKGVRFYLLVGLASLMHFPALVFLPAYLLSKLRMNHGYIVLMAGLLSVTFILRGQILTFMMDAYGNDAEEMLLNEVGFLRTKSIIMICIILVALLLRPVAGEKDEYKLLVLFMEIAVVFQTFCGYNNIFERLADYYFQFSVIFIPMIFDYRAARSYYFDPASEAALKAYLPFIFCAFGIWRFANTILNNAYYFLPYRFFFS